MKATKENLKTIQKYLRMFDFFGESFTFRYKDEDKHSTVLGGLICISFADVLNDACFASSAMSSSEMKSYIDDNLLMSSMSSIYIMLFSLSFI